MSSYEELLDEAYKNGLVVFENYAFTESPELKGLIVGNKIALSNTLTTEKERKCILAEEIAHSLLNTGNITDLNQSNNRRQEYKAHKKAITTILPLSDIINAVRSLGESANICTIANELDITEEFLREAIQIYSSIYPEFWEYGDLIITFYPTFRIMKKGEVLIWQD